MIKVWDQDVCFYVVSSSISVVTNMIATKALHDR